MIALYSRLEAGLSSLRPARSSHGRKRPDALRRAYAGAAGAAHSATAPALLSSAVSDAALPQQLLLRCSRPLFQTRLYLLHPCSRPASMPSPCAPVQLCRFIPLHHCDNGRPQGGLLHGTTRVAHRVGLQGAFTAFVGARLRAKLFRRLFRRQAGPHRSALARTGVQHGCSTGATHRFFVGVQVAPGRCAYSRIKHGAS